MKRFGVLAMVALLAACTAVPRSSAPRPQTTAPPRIQPTVSVSPPTRVVRPPAVGFRSTQVQPIAGLEAVLEQDAASLERMFGAPRLEVNEGDARKLQFGGAACVLDVFLYPLREGAEPVATYAEARRASDGAEVDRAACVAALRR
jgi:hypothetical protein